MHAGILTVRGWKISSLIHKNDQSSRTLSACGRYPTITPQYIPRFGVQVDKLVRRDLPFAKDRFLWKPIWSASGLGIHKTTAYAHPANKGTIIVLSFFMKFLIAVCLSLTLFSCSNSNRSFNYSSYLDGINAECKPKCPRYKAASVFAESDCLRQCMLIEDTFR